MMNRALLSAIAASFAVAACSEKPAEQPKQQAAAVVPLPPEAPKAPAASANQDAKPAGMKQAMASMPGCGHGKCKIDIKVTEGATPCATATPDPLPVFKGNKGDDIKWSISTQGWKFASNGIEFAANNQFTGPSGGNTNSFKWKDANTDTNTYKYKIHLVNGAKKCDVDPSVVNGADTEQQ